MEALQGSEDVSFYCAMRSHETNLSKGVTRYVFSFKRTILTKKWRKRLSGARAEEGDELGEYAEVQARGSDNLDSSSVERQQNSGSIFK